MGWNNRRSESREGRDPESGEIRIPGGQDQAMESEFLNQKVRFGQCHQVPALWFQLPRVRPPESQDQKARIGNTKCVVCVRVKPSCADNFLLPSLA